MLEQLGCRVVIAEDGRAAVEHGRTTPLRRHPHGLPDAGHGRLRGNRRDPARGEHRGTVPDDDHRTDRQRADAGPRALPGGGDGLLPGQAVHAGPARADSPADRRSTRHLAAAQPRRGRSNRPSVPEARAAAYVDAASTDDAARPDCDGNRHAARLRLVCRGPRAAAFRSSTRSRCRRSGAWVGRRSSSVCATCCSRRRRRHCARSARRSRPASSTRLRPRRIRSSQPCSNLGGRRLAEQLDASRTRSASKRTCRPRVARRPASSRAYAQLETALRGQTERSTGT